MQLLADGARLMGLSLSPSQVAAFETYYRELVAWNERVNLTRITQREEVITKHFLDSLSIYPVLSKLHPPVSTLIDIGSGAGFPGLPLKIVLPSLALTLLEATGKKTAFLHHLVERLALTGVTVVTGRAEDAAHSPDHRERYAVAVARAVARLDTLAELTLPFVQVGGWVIAQKGEAPGAEAAGAARALDLLGGGAPEIRPVRVPGLDAERHLVVMAKVRATPDRYPRRAGLPAKKPLR